MAVAVTALAYTSPATKRLLVGLIPCALVALLYDAMRFVKNVGLDESTVHICDLRSAELRWFGIGSGAARVTLHDWFQAHPSLPLDVFFAVPYGTFLMVVVGYAVFLYRRHFESFERFTWGFFALNVVGFLTYHLYPAAPPWYYHQHGCIVDLASAASAGPNLLRVDEWLGVRYFSGFYSRSSDIFGAVPSLHVAYPLLIVIEGWRPHRALGRTLLVGFYAWMCCAAVYLDHHWVIDIVLGTGYAVVTAFAIRRIDKWRRSRDTIPASDVTPVLDAGENEVEQGHA
jgi:hypothetical protein